MIRSLAVAALVLLPAAGSVDAAAQDGRLKTDLTVPDPARCAADPAVAPRPIADLEPYAVDPGGGGVIIGVASPEVGAETAKADTADIESSGGTPADAERAGAATETLELLFACENANDPRRAFALFTDAGLGRVLPGYRLTTKDLAFLADTPDPPPAPKEVWIAISRPEVAVLPDGRLRATVTGSDADGPFAAVAILIETDGRYLIDDLVTTPTGPGADRTEKSTG